MQKTKVILSDRVTELFILGIWHFILLNHTDTPPSHAAAADPRLPSPSPNSLRGAPNAAAAEPFRLESARRLDDFSFECFTSWFSAFIRTVAVRGQWHWMIHKTHESFHLITRPFPCMHLRAPRTRTNNLFRSSLLLIELFTAAVNRTWNRFSFHLGLCDWTLES